SLKNKFEIAKNFITFNNTEGKTKNQKKLDQMIKNQANKNALNSISGNNQDEKTNKLNEFITKNENIVKDYRKKNILERIAIASVPFKGILNVFKENKNFNQAKEILKDFKKVKDNDSLEKFVDKNQSKINDNQ
ncbi:MAG: hypothetical protein ACKN9I_01485, partial [Alphaproteobacteria bacterium]